MPRAARRVRASLPRAGADGRGESESTGECSTVRSDQHASYAARTRHQHAVAGAGRAGSRPSRPSLQLTRSRVCVTQRGGEAGSLPSGCCWLLVTVVGASRRTRTGR